MRASRICSLIKLLKLIFVEGEDYKAVSEDGVLHQAVAVWEDRKPLELLRQALDEENTRQLEVNRVSFMRYVKGEDFLRVALMRVPGEVAGYVSDDIGIIKYYNNNNNNEEKEISILFHSSDVRIFKKSLDRYRGSCKKVTFKIILCLSIGKLCVR